MKVSRITVTVEPWVHSVAAGRPGPSTIEVRSKIEIGGLPDLHVQEVMRETDFTSYFQRYMKALQHKIEKIVEGIEAKTVTVSEDGAELLVGGKPLVEAGNWGRP